MHNFKMGGLVLLLIHALSNPPLKNEDIYYIGFHMVTYYKCKAVYIVA